MHGHHPGAAGTGRHVELALADGVVSNALGHHLTEQPVAIAAVALHHAAEVPRVRGPQALSSRAFVDIADIMMLYPVVDVSGLNRISRQMLANAAHALACMLCVWQPAPADALSAIGLSMFGVTTACVQGVPQALQGGFDSLVFHAIGTGGQSLEKLGDDGTRAAMVDLLLPTGHAGHARSSIATAAGQRSGHAAARHRTSPQDHPSTV